MNFRAQLRPLDFREIGRWPVLFRALGVGLTFVLVTHNLAVVAHMCDRLAVMNQGRIVEELSVDQLRANEPSEAYTRQLLKASLGYDREAARSLATFD